VPKGIGDHSFPGNIRLLFYGFRGTLLAKEGEDAMICRIQKYLQGHPWSQTIQWLDCVDSTNTYAKQLARSGAAEGTIVLADLQTGGRGRLGRSFSSPAGMGIYMSVILRPDCLPEEMMHLTCAAGLYACLAVEDCVPTTLPPKIKWANDLVLGQKKLGGILTEISVEPVSRKVEWAVVGIGINCCQQPADFPPEIRDMATSLSMTPADRPALIVALIRRMHQLRQDLFAEKATINECFYSRCITIGKRISILQGDTVRHGKALTVDADGELWVQLDDGSEIAVSSGEVSIRGMYGYV
jgi:BirA family biotin operon repressor/biotin-[acetyl-CoA-carboxylase] ligase